MKLITNFKDYYDSVQMYEQDRSIVYERLQKSVSVKELEEKFPGKYKDILQLKGEGSSDYYFRIMFFCGKMYPFMSLYDKEDYHYPHRFIYRYNVEECVDVLEDVLKWRRDRQYFSWLPETVLHGDSINHFFKDFSKESELNIDLNCPVILYHINSQNRGQNEFILNPHLKSFHFFRVHDAGQTFQMIESYISGVLSSSQAPMVKIDEKRRLEKRGFDAKLSFRKQKNSIKK